MIVRADADALPEGGQAGNDLSSTITRWIRLRREIANRVRATIWPIIASHLALTPGSRLGPYEAILRRIFSLGIKHSVMIYKPHVPALKENNVRKEFFDREQFEAVRKALPVAVQSVVTFAYVTGWRIQSEVLPLEWRQVDREAGEVRLDPGTTKE
jgi:integrase